MCGICCCLFADTEISRNNFQVISDCILPHLERRGPDHTGRKDFRNKNYRGTFLLSLTGTLLHLRGRKTPQPLLDDRGNVLLWNGEIFGGIEVKEKENDSLVLLKILSNPGSDVTHSQHILSTMAKVQGPWSFVYWQATEQKLWFGRDYFGRRSLLWHLPSNVNDVLAITSVTERNSTAADKNLRFEEIPADGLYCVDLVNDISEEDYEQPFRINKYEWNQADEDLQHVSFLTCPVTPFNKQMPNGQDLLAIEQNRRRFCLANKREMCREIEEKFVGDGKTLVVQESCIQGASRESVAEDDISSFKIAENVTELDNLENGDSSFKADLGRSLEDCTDATSNLTHSAPARNGELNFCDDHPWQRSNCHSKFNVDFESSQACCMETSTDNVAPNEVIGMKNIPEDGSRRILNRHTWNLSFDELRDGFIVVLGKAVKKRVFNLPRTDTKSILPGSEESSSDLTSARVSTDQSCAPSSLQLKDARVGILFSGGIDSMMIAALADKFVPTEEAIDLINVAFEQKPQAENPQNKKGRKGKIKQHATTSTKPAAKKFSVPDRITGLSGLEELQGINPARQWNFVEVDVTLEELQEERSRHISHLVSPLNTVLDDSIGCALWFAARGRGRLFSSVKDGEAENGYTSKAKVLLVGMGADEQLGGYSRHRTRFVNESWTGLMDEMEMEVKRISKRNLGRDDRCISDHGREARFPFLDEDVVCFLNSLPVWVKTDPGLSRGTGEKLLLRQAARLLGLTSSSELPKRAIQFGSRIAKLESCGEKGSEACARLEF